MVLQKETRSIRNLYDNSSSGFSHFILDNIPQKLISEQKLIKFNHNNKHQITRINLKLDQLRQKDKEKNEKKIKTLEAERWIRQKISDCDYNFFSNDDHELNAAKKFTNLIKHKKVLDRIALEQGKRESDKCIKKSQETKNELYNRKIEEILDCQNIKNFNTVLNCMERMLENENLDSKPNIFNKLRFKSLSNTLSIEDAVLKALKSNISNLTPNKVENQLLKTLEFQKKYHEHDKEEKKLNNQLKFIAQNEAKLKQNSETNSSRNTNLGLAFLKKQENRLLEQKQNLKLQKDNLEKDFTNYQDQGLVLKNENIANPMLATISNFKNSPLNQTQDKFYKTSYFDKKPSLSWNQSDAYKKMFNLSTNLLESRIQAMRFKNLEGQKIDSSSFKRSNDLIKSAKKTNNYQKKISFLYDAINRDKTMEEKDQDIARYAKDYPEYEKLKGYHVNGFHTPQPEYLQSLNIKLQAQMLQDKFLSKEEIQGLKDENSIKKEKKEKEIGNTFRTKELNNKSNALKTNPKELSMSI